MREKTGEEKKTEKQNARREAAVCAHIFFFCYCFTPFYQAYSCFAVRFLGLSASSAGPIVVSFHEKYQMNLSFFFFFGFTHDSIECLEAKGNCPRLSLSSTLFFFCFSASNSVRTRRATLFFFFSPLFFLSFLLGVLPCDASDSVCLLFLFPANKGRRQVHVYARAA